MKKLLITLVLFFQFYGMLYSAPVEPVNTMNVPGADTPPIIDGIADDVYSDVQQTDAMNPEAQGDAWDGETDYQLDFQVCWDYQYLYFYAEIQDDIEHDYEWDTGDPWTFDNVEVFLQLDTNTLSATSSDSLAIQLRICRGLDSVETHGRASRSSYQYYMEAQAPGGWITEVAIPWTAVLAESMQPEDLLDYINSPIGFDVAGADSDGSGDTGARDFQTAWDLDGQDGTEDLAWNDCSVFGYIMLQQDITPVPVANAGSNQTVYENETVFLDGTSSYDPQGSLLNYTWTAPAGITLEGIHSARPSFVAPAVNADTQYTFGLTVDDGSDQSLTDYVTITVLNNNNSPIAQAGEDQTVYELSLVMLDGSASSDPNQDSLSFEWTSVQNLPMLQAYQSTAMLVAPEVDTTTKFQFTLRVNDGNSYSATDTVNLTVLNQENIANSIADINKQAIQVYPNPASGYLNIDAEVSIESLDIFDINGKMMFSQKVNSRHYRLDINALKAGTYILLSHTENGVLSTTFNIE